jgi:hypothetical protein
MISAFFFQIFCSSAQENRISSNEKALLETEFKSENSNKNLFEKNDSIDMENNEDFQERNIIIDMQVNKSETSQIESDDISSSAFDFDEADFKKIEESQKNENTIGIKSRDTLNRLETPDTLQVLKRKQRLKPLSISEIDANANKLKRPDYLQFEKHNIAAQQETDPNNVFMRTQVNDNANIRANSSTVRRQDDVGMTNSGRIVLKERVEREEFKRRQERLDSRKDTRPAADTSKPYLPDGKLITNPVINVPFLPGGK